MTNPRHTFLQGPRGVGKTTLLFRYLKTLGTAYGGFVVKKVYAAGIRVSMDMFDLSSGLRRPLVTFDNKGRPSVELGTFLSVGIPSIMGAVHRSELVVMDELGRFETASPDFMRAVFSALDSPSVVLGVLKDESNVFLDAVRSRSDVRIIRVNPENRLEVQHRLTPNLAARAMVGRTVHQ